jgi:transcription-repair coupling factor (superfamily II helicase)
MRLEGIMKPLKDSDEFIRLLGDVNKGNYPLSAYGLSESGKSYLINGIF